MHDALRTLITAGLLVVLAGCTTLGSMMSPYSETFSCKNSDHGQCIHPDQAYADAVADRPSQSDPSVTNARGHSRQNAAPSAPGKQKAAPNAYAGYRDSIYQELKALVDAPATPMLRPPETVRTLILPYADRQRPDRLYMPRYVYSILDRPAWVVGGYLVDPLPAAATMPVLGQARERPTGDDPQPSARPAESRP